MNISLTHKRHQKHSTSIATINARLALSEYHKRLIAVMMKRTKAIDDFIGSVNVVGLDIVFDRSASLARRSCWSLLVVVGIVFIGGLVTSSISYYVADSSTVDIQIVRPDQVPFPTITLCDTNAYGRGVFTNEEYERLALFRSISGDATETVDEVLRDCRETKHSEDSGGSCEGILADFKRSENASFDQKRLLDYQARKMVESVLLQCTFKQKPCTREQVVPVRTDILLMGRGCAVFNPLGKETIDVGGVKQGLSIIMNISGSTPDLLDPRLSMEWGMQGSFMILHTPGRYSQLSNDVGMLLSTGFGTLTTVTRTDFAYLEKLGQCTNQQELRYIPQLNYTKNSCLAECAGEFIRYQCGCVDFSTPLGDALITDAPGCRTIHDFLCRAKTMKELVTNGTLHRQRCGYCEQECRNVVYERQMSLVPVQVFGSAGSLTVTVGLRNTQYNIFTQQEAYTLSNLMSDVGGALGLLLGCSLYTLVILVECIGRLLYDQFHKTKSEISVDSIDHQTEITDIVEVHKPAD